MARGETEKVVEIAQIGPHGVLRQAPLGPQMCGEVGVQNRALPRLVRRLAHLHTLTVTGADVQIKRWKATKRPRDGRMRR